MSPVLIPFLRTPILSGLRCLILNVFSKPHSGRSVKITVRLSIKLQAKQQSRLESYALYSDESTVLRVIGMHAMVN
jgi:hypothetical protein